MMSLIVYTSRISSRDPDRFDVTRKSGKEDGLAFAPSWAILRPALEVRGSGPEAAFYAWQRYVPACHRTLLGRFILPRLGAKYMGEV